MAQANNTSLTIEQKIVKHLANKGYLTAGGDIQRALVDPEYAIKLITDVPEGDELCAHESLSFDKIEEVFTNDFE